MTRLHRPSPALRTIYYVAALLVSAFARLPAHAAIAPATATGGTRAPFARSIRALPAAALDANGRKNSAYISRSVLRPDELAASTDFEIVLALRNPDELRARLDHGEVIPWAELESRFLPLPAAHDRLVRWLTAEGLTVRRTDANRVAIFGRGSVAAVARVFETTFARVATERGEFTSAIAAPSLPVDLAPAVLGLHGLQPHQRLRPHARLLPQASSGGSLPYYPSQIAKAYGSSSLGLTGAGQTIAIYALAFPATSDLTRFWTTTSTPGSVGNIQNIPVGEGPSASPDSGYLDEVTLDVEWASGIAPGATIRIYAAHEESAVADDEIIQQVLADVPNQPAMHQLSISYGIEEPDVDRDYAAIQSQYMSLLSAAGVTVFASSGDAGAIGNGNDTLIKVCLPASLPDVTSVGGTALTLDASNNVSGEFGWGNLANSGSTGSSGGGASMYFSRPAWQTGSGVPAGGFRVIPDVAAVGDPSTGAFIVSAGVNRQVGGTSLSSPIWAGWCALLNQARAAAGQPPLGALNPRLYPLLGTSAFRDITRGGNSVFVAAAGYDQVTGLGAPVVDVLSRTTLTDTQAAYAQIQSGTRFTTTGQSATFYVFAGGSPAPAYRWQRRASGTSTWVDVVNNATFTGAATATLVVSNAAIAMNGDQFQCLVSNSGGSFTSTPAALTVATTGVSTLAGWPQWSGSADGAASAARFSYPGSIRTDSAGNAYVADASNHTVRKVTPAGVVTTLAGLAGAGATVDGTGSAARFNGPAGVAVDTVGNVFVIEATGNTVRKITPAGVVTTLAGTPGVSGSTDGPGASATFTDPQNVAIDLAGNLYVADGSGHTIRKVTPAGVVSTFAGLAGVSGTANGLGGAARFNFPAGIIVDAAGNVYVGDTLNNAIRKITPAGVVSTIAGTSTEAANIDGSLAAARFDAPADVALDPAGNLYVADSLNNTVRKITLNPLAAPALSTQPATATIASGQSTTFTVVASGTAPFTYQWQRQLSGSTTWSDLTATAPFSGVTTATLTVTAAVVALDGSQFRCVVQNSAGSTTSSAASLFVTGLPSVAAGSQSQPVYAGGSVTLSVAATGRGLSYQWSLNGTPLVGATSSTLTVSNFSATNAGTYAVAVSNTSGSVSSTIATLTLTTAYLTNLSVRNAVGTGADILVVGFVVAGTENKSLLLRGAGPVLTSFGVTGALARPVLTLSPSGGAALATNSTWSDNAATLTPAFAAVAAFPFPDGSNDTALFRSLAPGGYSAQIAGAAGTTGVALAELYDSSPTTASRLTNVSARAPVGTGDNVLIVGFVIGGTGSERLLIRGIGPALTGFGVPGVLARPVLTIANSSGTVVATNAGWADDPALAAVFRSVAAFDLPAGSLDAAVVVTVPAGSYSAKLSGANATTGTALVELYEVR